MSKPDLRIVPQPEGFELRAARMDKHEDGSLWNPQDVLHDVSKRFAELQEQGTPVESIVVAWREDCDKSSFRPRFRQAGPQGHMPQLLLSALGRIMGWR